MSAVHRATQAIAPRSAPSDGFASLRAMASGALPRLCHGFASLPKGRRPSATGPRWHRPLVRRHTGPGPPCQDRCRLSRKPVAAAPKIPWEARSPHPWPRLPPSVVTAVSEGESTNHHCLIQSSCNQQTTRENKQLVEIVLEWQRIAIHCSVVPMSILRRSGRETELFQPRKDSLESRGAECLLSATTNNRPQWKQRWDAKLSSQKASSATVTARTQRT